MPHREPFDPKRPLVAARAFIFAGKSYIKGDPFPGPDAADVTSFPRRLIERQYSAFAINHAPEDNEVEDLIQMTGPKGGRYTITAPWLEKPLVIRGKVNATKALADMREEGPPPDWSNEGSATGDDDNSDKSDFDEASGNDAEKGSGTDDADDAEGADKAGDGEAAAEGAEAGKSDTDPATA